MFLSDRQQRRPSLFSFGNKMLQEKRVEDAVAIYEYLTESRPEFSQYAYNNDLARRSLAKVNDRYRNKPKRRYHFNSADDFQKRLRIADLISKQAGPEHLSVCFDDAEIQRIPQCLLSFANASIPYGYDQWLRYVNTYLEQFSLSPLYVRPFDSAAGGMLYLNLVASRLPRVEGPLVTVCISCFNAEPYVEHALNSILNQSYHNFELILFNDHSSDETLNVLRRAEKRDRRIRVIDNEFNQGTYISRNQAFAQAKGKYFTILDADDFALPDRLALQVAHLEEHPDHQGVLSDWVRICSDGRFHFKGGWGGKYQHEAVATLMVRTSVQKRVGYWDSVRFAADTEFLFRLRKVYGEKMVPILEIPTVIALYHEASLTNDPETGIGIDGLSPVRRYYRDNWMNWHKASAHLFVPFPLAARLFDAPPEMLLSHLKNR
jgi:glycosyltransferase involved in cell wall biosynthesis